ncbi:MAG: S41 family peptidase [Bacteroidota bacterium]
MADTHTQPLVEDFLYFWETIQNDFVYFDVKQVDWQQVKSIYLPRIEAIEKPIEFIPIMEEVVRELYSGHMYLMTHIPQQSHQLVPSGADVWAEFVGDAAVIIDVKEGGLAEKVGIKVGMKVHQVEGKPIKSQVEALLPKAASTHTKEMYAFAVNTLLAGKHDADRHWEVVSGGEKQVITLTKTTLPTRPLFEKKILEGNIGYLRLHNSLGNNELIPHIESIFQELIDTVGLILDLRDTPGGGNSTVARAIMGHLTDAEVPYQRHEFPWEERVYGVKRRWVEYVSPRQPYYAQPVVVLVGRWTASMGEGLTIGLEGMQRAEVVGTQMGQLRGSIYTYQMPNTQIGFAIPTEKLFHLDGTPREDFLPQHLVNHEGEALNTGIKVLEQMLVNVVKDKAASRFSNEKADSTLI